MNPGDKIEASEVPLRGIARGGRARGRGRTLMSRSQPVVVERPVEVQSVTDTISQFNRDEELEKMLSTTNVSTLSMEDSASSQAAHAYMPSVVDSHAAARSSSVGPSSIGTGSKASFKRRVEMPVISRPRGFVKTGTKGKQVTHKVLRTDSVYENILSIGKNPRLSRIEFEQQIRAMFVDSIVITHYNKKTYRISDIDFKRSSCFYIPGSGWAVPDLCPYFDTQKCPTLMIPDGSLEARPER